MDHGPWSWRRLLTKSIILRLVLSKSSDCCSVMAGTLNTWTSIFWSIAPNLWAWCHVQVRCSYVTLCNKCQSPSNVVSQRKRNDMFKTNSPALPAPIGGPVARILQTLSPVICRQSGSVVWTSMAMQITWTINASKARKVRAFFRQVQDFGGC